MGNLSNNSGKANSRNAVIDLMKFVFAVMIVLYHSKNYTTDIKICTGGYIAVDFFFIVSGYFLAASASKRRSSSPDGDGLRYVLGDTAHYMGRRISRIYPEMIVAIILALIARAAVYDLSFGEVWTFFLQAYGEWTMLQQLGLDTKVILGGTWYISAMMIASCFLYPMARKAGKRFDLLIAPAMFIFLFVLTITHMTNIQVPNVKIRGLVYFGLLRGTMEMALGCFVFGLKNVLARFSPGKPAKYLLTIAEAGLYLSIVCYYSHGKHYNRIDWFTIILFGIAILITQTNFSYTKDVIKGKVYVFLGALSFDLYLGHRFWSLLIKNMDWLKPQGDLYKTAVYLVLATVTAFIIMYGSKLLTACFRKIFQSIRRKPELT